MGQSPGRRLAVTDLVLMKRLRLDELQQGRNPHFFKQLGRVGQSGSSERVRFNSGLWRISWSDSAAAVISSRFPLFYTVPLLISASPFVTPFISQ